MKTVKAKRILEIAVLIISIGLIVWAAPEMMERFGWELGGSEDEAASYIVQGLNLLEVSTIVIREGGEITHTLPTNNAVGALLTTSQIKALLNMEGIYQIYQNRPPISRKVVSTDTIFVNG